MGAQPVDTSASSNATCRRPPTRAELATWIRQLPLRRPLPCFDTVEQLLDATGQRRGRPIILRPTPHLPRTICGLWLACDTEDVVLVDAALAGFRRDLVVMHEAAHVWFGHRGRWTSAAGALPHRCFDVRQEWQAEWLATFLLAHTRGLHRSGWVAHESTRRAAGMLAGGG